MNEFTSVILLARRAAALIVAAAIVFVGLAGCSDHPNRPGAPAPRTFRMGFSAIPPRLDQASLLAALDVWTRRADAAIMHLEPPWDSLLAGVRPDSLVIRNQLALAQYYRAKGLMLFVTLDATNGLDRSADSALLTAAGRSLVEPTVQQLYRRYAVAIDTLLDPEWMALAAETNLIRAAAPSPLYAAVVAVANAAAADVRAYDATVQLDVSVQVEVAWGRLGGSGGYAGVSADLADFPFVQGLGLSSYPYLGGFDEPEQVPLDYYARVGSEAGLPVMVVEGGWTSAAVGGVDSSPEKQARWIRRHVQLLDFARALAVFQLTFTDLDVSTFPLPPGSILPLFAHLGLVDVDLLPKPALAPWDSAFARPN